MFPFPSSSSHLEFAMESCEVVRKDSKSGARKRKAIKVLEDDECENQLCEGLEISMNLVESCLSSHTEQKSLERQAQRIAKKGAVSDSLNFFFPMWLYFSNFSYPRSALSSSRDTSARLISCSFRQT